MLQKLDLPALAEEIELPYRPLPLASLASLDASLFVCHDKNTWHRSDARAQIMLVLEGVITVDGPQGRIVVHEGEAAVIPAKVPHNIGSGMRSTVVLFQEQPPDGSQNGHHPSPDMPLGAVSKVGIAAGVHANPLFNWLAVGDVGSHAVAASRLWGRSEAYEAPLGGLAILVYRGVLDYATADASDTAVGSQLLVVPAGQQITLSSERGATVLALARAGKRLPQPLPSGSAEPSADPGEAGA